MDILNQLVEVTFKEADDFLKIKETLTRIGIASNREEKKLFQSCHILHKRGKYYIVHFKELFALDGKPASVTDNDIARRNTIVKLLYDWGLIQTFNKNVIHDSFVPVKEIKIIPFKDKKDWILEPKYSIGNSRKNS